MALLRESIDDATAGLMVAEQHARGRRWNHTAAELRSSAAKLHRAARAADELARRAERSARAADKLARGDS